MASTEERMLTFKAKRWIFKTGSCSALNMAKAGFLCTAKRAVQCYYCDKELDGWEEMDDPWQEHKKHAGYCPFVNKYQTAPDSYELTILESVQLEKERLLLKIKQKYEQTKLSIENIFQQTLKERTAAIKKQRVEL